MPELTDDMYCSQQIMVPPMFPYILRQYAKAAIRSQPSDLLRWSTAYFRCLSLNLPPPVKPRLEYPLPKDYDGVTPGWLKALMYQLINNTHVDFKVLWDRWIGACQNHTTLIKILCLGAFTDPMAVPLFRFIGLCVGFLNENLTQTMIMFCEVVTEEPEGGSAMISVETFIDVYTFLAAIDASKDQVLLNRYFTDDLLALLEKKEEKKEEEKKAEVKAVEKEASLSVESVVEEQKQEDDNKDAISCPDLVEDGGADTTTETDDDGSKSTIVDDKERYSHATGKSPSQIEAEKEAKAVKKMVRHSEMVEFDESAGDGGEEEGADADRAADDAGSELGLASDTAAAVAAVEEDAVPEPAEVIADDADEIDEDEADANADGEKPEEETAAGTTEEVSEKPQEQEDLEEERKDEAGIEEYLDQQSILGESMLSDEVEIVPKSITRVEELDEYSVEDQGEPEGEEEVVPEKFEVEEVFVERIPGIGAIVPADLVEAVVKYMKVCAEAQHGMVMPRNIRHYNCPPLEEYKV